MNKSILIIIALFITICLFMLMNKNQNNTPLISLKKDATILAYGDSITYGYGVSKAFSYPSQLEKRTGLHVINAGISGEQTNEGLRRLPKFLEKKPDLVILCHGGNDIIRRHSQSELKNNLLKMIELIEASGAEVLLIGVPDFGLLGFDTYVVYDEVAEETGVFYEGAILSFIEADNSLKIDAIHPDAKGYEVMVDTIVKKLYIH